MVLRYAEADRSGDDPNNGQDSPTPYANLRAADAHPTFDNPMLNAEKIIAHHNRLLSGIVERVVPAAEIKF